MMEKSHLRKEACRLMVAQDRELKKERDCALHQAFWAHPAYRSSQVIALFLSMENEVDTAPLVQQALADQKQVLVPKVLGKGQMVFCPYQADQLELSTFGVLEPRGLEAFPVESIDLIVVPGLVWNTAGYRIGYGGGYYDRYLANYKGASMSLAYPFQLQPFSPDSFDIPVEEVLTCE